jgi:hypothetical protein
MFPGKVCQIYRKIRRHTQKKALLQPILTTSTAVEGHYTTYNSQLNPVNNMKFSRC